MLPPNHGFLYRSCKLFLLAIITLLLTGCFVAATTPIGSGGSKVSFAGVTFPGQRVVYILQASGAAIDDWESACKLVEDSIAHLSPAQRFEVIWNKPGGQPVGLFGRLQYATRESVDKVSVSLSGVTPRGQVNLYPSLRQALTLRPDVVVLYASGGDVEGDLVERVCRLRSFGIPIYVLSYCTDMGENDWLKTLGKLTGGGRIYGGIPGIPVIQY